MADLITLSELRADKEQNARLWTPLDCLRAVVRDLENGELRPVDAVYVAMLRREDGQATGFPFYTAGAATIELRGILAQHMHDICAAFVSPRF